MLGPNIMLGDKHAAPCDMFHKAVYAHSQMWGCPLVNCPLPLRLPKDGRFKDDVSWDEMAMLDGSYDPRMPPSELHATKRCPLEEIHQGERDVPKSGDRNLKNALRRNGDDRCPNLHGYCSDVANEAMGYFKQMNERMQCHWVIAHDLKKKLMAATPFVDAKGVGPGMSADCVVVPVQTNATRNAIRARDPHHGADCKAMGFAQMHFYNDVSADAVKPKVRADHQVPWIEDGKGAFTASCRQRLSQLQRAGKIFDRGGLCPWQYEEKRKDASNKADQYDLAEVIMYGDMDRFKSFSGVAYIFLAYAHLQRDALGLKVQNFVGKTFFRCGQTCRRFLAATRNLGIQGPGGHQSQTQVSVKSLVNCAMWASSSTLSMESTWLLSRLHCSRRYYPSSRRSSISATLGIPCISLWLLATVMRCSYNNSSVISKWLLIKTTRASPGM